MCHRPPKRFAAVEGIVLASARHIAQITYNGWPLYFFELDTKPGMTKGDGLKGQGREWQVVHPRGLTTTAGVGGLLIATPA
jgi:hypothetical protein